jgi:hypothetical protein
MISDAAKPYSPASLRPLLLCMAASAVVAVCASFVPVARHGAATVIENILWLVPSVERISRETPDPEISEIILLSQWLFAPAYALIWFYCLAPWSPRMRQVAMRKSQTLTPVQRAAGLPIAILFFVAWLLGDFGIIHFPTFYNGEFLYPLDHAVPQLRIIHTSRIAMAIYAWIGPLAEVWVIWMLCLFVVNAKAYFSPQQT